MAGGAGTRLYPITAYVPKALIPIGNRYVIEYQLDYLKTHGIRDIVMLVSDSEYELFRNHLGEGSRFGTSVEYSVEKRIGTAGALKAAERLLGQRFVVYYGDVLTHMDLKAMIDFHEGHGSICTLAMSTSVPMEYGIGKVAPDGRVVYFEEKPILKEYPVSMGIYVLEKEALSYCKVNMDIAQDVIPMLIRDKRPVFGYLTPQRHYDIGTFKILEEVRTLVERNKQLFQGAR